MARKVFISFAVEDKDSVVLLRGQAKNKNSELEFYDHSVKTPYNSVDAAYIKSEIRPKIRQCSVLLCVVGKTTSKSDWVNWEIEYAADQGKGIVVLNLSSAGQKPKALEGLKHEEVDWVISDLVDAIEKAAKNAGY